MIYFYVYDRNNKILLYRGIAFILLIFSLLTPILNSLFWILVVLLLIVYFILKNVFKSFSIIGDLSIESSYIKINYYNNTEIVLSFKSITKLIICTNDYYGRIDSIPFAISEGLNNYMKLYYDNKVLNLKIHCKKKFNYSIIKNAMEEADYPKIEELKALPYTVFYP